MIYDTANLKHNLSNIIYYTVSVSFFNEINYIFIFFIFYFAFEFYFIYQI